MTPFDIPVENYFRYQHLFLNLARTNYRQLNFCANVTCFAYNAKLINKGNQGNLKISGETATL
jgi:hypothetical protein